MISVLEKEAEKIKFLRNFVFPSLLFYYSLIGFSSTIFNAEIPLLSESIIISLETFVEIELSLYVLTTWRE
jgi:hypothetical protein